MTSPSLINMLLIDDHFVVRSGIVASLELEDDICIVAQGERGEQASSLYDKHRPHVVLMDLQLSGISGVEATKLLLTAFPQAHVLIFSTFARDDEIQAA
ncbi:MAG: response regulator containing a CheY-like receiver domain and an DNA-binding domain, partial [Verrucomicrobiaceae bacterium]|nr:response regulator containing a CheY-like receiver domain and an DNA-binding domain [Verrucomicrobiaceae bacterium]